MRLPNTTTMAVAALVLTILSVGCSRSSSRTQASHVRPTLPSTKLLQPPTVTLPDGTAIKLELAETPEEHQRGLMFRPHLDADRGMLFLFDQVSYPSFWMKDTLIPLDMVFLDPAGKVTDVVASVPPCHSEPCQQYSPSKPSSAVLELNAGTAADHGIEPGVTLHFNGVPSLILGR